MGYTVSFGSITKRENSTASGYTESLSASCLLKDGTDILRPTFSLQLGSDFPLTANYMYVSDFHRYYWITGIHFERGVWYVSGEVDVLATYKSQIGATQAYVLRAASQYDEYIPDTIFPFESIEYLDGQTESVGFSTEGVVLICTAGVDNDAPSQSYYALVPYMWEYIYSFCFTSGFLTDLDNAWSGLGSLLLNGMIRPEDYISSAIWLPVDYTAIDASIQQVCLGYTKTAAVGKAITPDVLLTQGSKQLTLPTHPQAAAYGDWLRGNAARKISLHLPGYGDTVLDADLCYVAGNIVSVAWAIDCSGVITYRVAYGGKITFYSANISTAVGWSVSRPDVRGAIASAGGIVASAVSGSPLGMAASVGNAITNCIPRVERMTAGGSRTLPAIDDYIFLFCEDYRLPASLDFSTTGRPLCKTVTINTLSGYVLCDSTVSVPCSGTREEIERIKGYLTGGFYYE